MVVHSVLMKAASMADSMVGLSGERMADAKDGKLVGLKVVMLVAGKVEPTAELMALMQAVQMAALSVVNLVWTRAPRLADETDLQTAEMLDVWKVELMVALKADSMVLR